MSGPSHSRQFKQRAGFTLIELLVVIAIIAILIGLLIPAVQKVRDSAARSSCGNNMHQLALAIHAYHDANQQFPPAVMMNTAAYSGGLNSGTVTSDTYDFGPNWVVLILPYIEQGNLYNQASASIQNYKNNIDDKGWRAIAQTPIKTMLCPADADAQQVAFTSTSNGSISGWARGSYAANAGPDWIYDSIGGSNTANDGFGVPGGGPMCINFGTSLSSLTNADGAANTMMLGEVRTGPGASDRRGTWAMGQVGGSIIAGYAIGDDTVPNAPQSCADDVQGCIDMASVGMGCWSSCPSQQATIHSTHASRSGANVVMCDGSVRFIQNSITPAVFYYMGGRADGVSYSY